MGFKVLFENNRPARAIPAEKDYSLNSITASSEDDNQTEIRTLYIEAANAEDAMRVAMMVVNAVLGNYSAMAQPASLC